MLELYKSNAVKLIGWHFKVQLYNDSKHMSKSNQDLFESKKWIGFKWLSQLTSLHLIENTFDLLKTKLRAESPTNKQQTKHLAEGNCV